MTAHFILTIYREKGIPIQHHNYSDMVEACSRAMVLKSERWVRKVELSVILHVWDKQVQ